MVVMVNGLIPSGVDPVDGFVFFIISIDGMHPCQTEPFWGIYENNAGQQREKWLNICSYEHIEFP